MVKTDRSKRSGYTLSVYYGDVPDTERSSVLHLNLKKQTGLHDSGMHWRTYLAGGERTGHAWDDNLPDPALATCDFETWVIDCISDIVGQLSRLKLAETIRQIQDTPPDTPEGWVTIRETLSTLEERMNLAHRLQHPNQMKMAAGICDGAEANAWMTTLGLARCAYELGERRQARRVAKRFTNGYFPKGFRGLTMVDSDVQALLPALLDHDPSIWCAFMKAPMRNMANFKPGVPYHGDSARSRFFAWLRTVECPPLMTQWAHAAVGGEVSHIHLARQASMVNLETMADAAVIMVDAAIKRAGDLTDYMWVLWRSLTAAGKRRRAAKVEAQLAAMGTSPAIREQLERYRTLYWPVYCRYQTGISLDRKAEILELMALEDSLNAHWRARPLDERPRHIDEAHFICGGTQVWVYMWRDAKEPDRAIERIESLFADWELVTLLCASDTQNMEALIDAACLAYLESSDPDGQEKAYALLTRVDREAPPTEDAQTHYNYACLYALCGDIDNALVHLDSFVASGTSKRRSHRISRIERDTDFKDVISDPRFVRALKDWKKLRPAG